MTRLRVVSWNVHWGTAHVPGRPRNELFDPLVELGPDVLGATDVVVFPEAWRSHNGESFLDGLAAHGLTNMVETSFTTLRIVGHNRRQLDDPGQGWWELAIATRHPIVADAELPLARSISDAVPQRHARSIRIDMGGREVDITAFHVSSKLWYAAPWVQLRSLGQLVADARVDGRDRPALLMGDANLWRTMIPFVLPGWRSTVRGATFPSWRPHSQIDHVLVRGEVDAVAGEVLPYSRTSDHRAISADLQLR
ncbi:MAG TPA: endonuclease/exonuclease/phosphatase family protein [Acidimicrobiia bacterium]